MDNLQREDILELDKEGTQWLVVVGILAVPRTQRSEEGTLAVADTLPGGTEGCVVDRASSEAV